jgi:hypothetical protein
MALNFQNRDGFEKAQAVRSFFAATASKPPRARRRISFFIARSVGTIAARMREPAPPQ